MNDVSDIYYKVQYVIEMQWILDAALDESDFTPPHRSEWPRVPSDI